MVTLKRLLSAYNIPLDRIRLVRHSNSEIPVLSTFRQNRNRFEAYQAFQNPNAFRNAQHLIVFSATQGTGSLLLGMWSIEEQYLPGQLRPDQLSLIERHQFPASWREENSFYQLRWNPALEELSERVIVDWGRSPRRSAGIRRSSRRSQGRCCYPSAQPTS